GRDKIKAPVPTARPCAPDCWSVAGRSQDPCGLASAPKPCQRALPKHAISAALSCSNRPPCCSCPRHTTPAFPADHADKLQLECRDERYWVKRPWSRYPKDDWEE